MAFGEEVPRPVVQLDDGAVLGGDPYQRRVPDEPQVAAGRGGHDAARAVQPGQQDLRRGAVELRAVGRRTGGRAGRRLGVDGPGQVVGDAGDDGGQLDGGSDVVDEVDQHPEVDGGQRERHRDRQVRDEGAADRDEREHGVEEGRHEGSQGQLAAPVSDEGAQHPRPELLGGERECHDHDREDDADYRDDCPGQGRQDLPGGVRRAADHPRRQTQLPVKGRLVDRYGDGEQGDRGQALDGGDEPEVGAERLLAPV